MSKQILLSTCFTVISSFVFFAEASVLQIKPNEILTSNAIGEFEVCWLGKKDSETSALRNQIQAYLEEQLTNRGGIRLKFIENCLDYLDPFAPIGIVFFDALDNPLGIQNALLGVASQTKNKGHPTTYSRGQWNQKNLVDMILTSRFQDVDPALVLQSHGLSEKGKLNLLKSIALHEFLHAFGFSHEQNHPDAICPGDNPQQLPRERTVTPYDPQSIMNYCHTHSFDFNDSAIPLSELDLLGLQKIYGLRP